MNESVEERFLRAVNSSRGTAGGAVSDLFRSPAEALRHMPDSAGRLSTGFPAIDRITRGGLRAGDVVTVVGGPGAAKSTLMEQIARHFADVHHSPVVALHADEGDGPASVRLGQMHGLDREKLEGKDAAEIAALEAETADCGYFMADPDEVPLEAAVEKLAVIKDDFPGPAVLLVDTLHTVRCSAADETSSAKERAEKIVEVYKAASRQIPAIVIVGSESAKSAYASQDQTKRTAPMAAPAETRQIAHAALLLVNMYPTAGDDSLFEAVVPKNRIGRTLTRFALRMDGLSATLTEVDAVVAIDEKAARKKARHDENLLRVQGVVEDLLKKYSKGLSVKAIHGRILGRKTDVLEALNGLENQGVAKWEEGPRGAHIWRFVS